MANIVIEIDTTEETMKVTVDGKTLKDVCMIHCCDTSEDEYSQHDLHLSINTCSESEDKSIKYMNSISLAGEGKLVRTQYKGSEAALKDLLAKMPNYKENYKIIPATVHKDKEK